MKLLSLIGLITLTTLASAQQVVTFTAIGEESTNSISIDSDQSCTLKTLVSNTGTGGRAYVYREDLLVGNYSDSSFRPNDGGFTPDKVFAGPAVVVVRTVNSAVHATLTLEISPSQYPPGKSAVIGERDGPMKCTLEESTDLVNWTQSTSGATHSLTNATAKKFFRIKLEQDVGP